MIVERKVFVIECDLCYRNEMFYATNPNETGRWPRGWVFRQDEGVGGFQKAYHYCPECSEQVSQAGS